MRNTFPISEIFNSIQGEGGHAGTPCVFVRFFGCNLSCHFCDEPLHKTHRVNLSIATLLNQVKKFQASHVVLTGGEPSLYNLNEFIQKLRAAGKYVQVETNGYKPSNISNANWVTYSPKDLSKVLHEDKWHFNEVKFLVDLSTDVGELLVTAQSLDCERYLQPVNHKTQLNKESVKLCINLCNRYPDLFRLSIQLHKVTGMK